MFQKMNLDQTRITSALIFLGIEPFVYEGWAALDRMSSDVGGGFTNCWRQVRRKERRQTISSAPDIHPSQRGQRSRRMIRIWRINFARGIHEEVDQISWSPPPPQGNFQTRGESAFCIHNRIDYRRSIESSQTRNLGRRAKGSDRKAPRGRRR